MRWKPWCLGRKLVFLSIIVILVSNFPISKSETQIWENQYGKLEVYPKTSCNIVRQTQYCNFTSYLDDTSIDVAFRFNQQISNPNIWIWKNISHDIQVPNYDWITQNYTLWNISDFQLISEPTSVVFGDKPSDYYANGNCSIFIIDYYEPLGYINIGFDSWEWQNTEHTICNFTYTYWGIVGYHIEQQYWYDWKNIKNKFNHIEYNGKHYYYVSEWLVKNKLYQFKWEYDISIHSDGKWDLLAKKSSDPIGTWRVSIDPWWSSSWDFFKSIWIDAALIDTDLTNFPVLVNNTNSTMIAKCDGGDSVRFLSTDNITEFYYEIEEWTANGFNIWVNISETLTSGSDYEFLMYYNNSAASDNQDKENTWDSNYTMVQHMNDSTTSSIADSTANDNDGAKAGANNPIVTPTGQIGDAQLFDGGDHIIVSDAASLRSYSTQTFEAWIYPTFNWGAGKCKIISKNSANAYAADLDWNDIGYIIDTAGGNVDHHPDWTYAGHHTNWHHMTGVYDGANIHIYINGTEVGVASAQNGEISDDGDDLFIGCTIWQTSKYVGTMDELRLSNINRNNSWINASYHNQNQTTGFLTWGDEQTVPPPYSNTCPVSSNPIPANASTDVSRTVGYWNVTVNDADGNNTWGNITCSNGNTSEWVNQANGTKSLEINTTLAYDTTYTVWLNFSDDYGCDVNDSFTFMTITGANFTITVTFPTNESTSINLQPTMYLTINHSYGQTMNISWYYGTTVGSENTLLGTDVNLTNSSQNEFFLQAIDRITSYYWRAQVDDGVDFYNETFWFTTEGYPGGGGNMPNYQVPMSIGSSALLIGLLGFLMRRKKKRRYE